MKVRYDQDGNIDGNIFMIPKRYRLKAFFQRLRIAVLNPYFVLMIIAFIILIYQFKFITTLQ